MKTFKIWLADEGDEESAGTIESVSPYSAAERFAKENWGAWDNPDEMEIRIRDASGELYVFTVEAEPTVQFYVYREQP